MVSVLASNLRELAEVAGLDAAALARSARIELRDLERYLAGTERPCVRQQHRLAHALGVTPADLHRDW